MTRRANKRRRSKRVQRAGALAPPPPKRVEIVKAFDPGVFFRQVAQYETIVRPSKEVPGALRCVAKPQRSKHFDWHKPVNHVPELQWQAATGETRYEFERRTTPPHQVDLFQRLQFRFQVEGPPALGSDRLWKAVEKARENASRLDNGLPGEDLGPELHAELSTLMIREYSPDGQWSFMAQAVRMSSGIIADRLDVKHRDYRTLADYALLCRLRAWVLPDARDVYMIWPGQDIHVKGWENRYENDTPNNLQLISPRSYADEDAPDAEGGAE